MIKTLKFFFESFVEEQMNLLYTGDFTDELTEKLIELNNYQFNKGNELNKTQRKVGFLIAECFQNIVRHADLAAADSYFHTQNKKGVFSIVSGNIVQDDMITTLKSQLKKLNELTSDELKEIYRKTLVDGTISEKGGAGLGLIEMARKTKNKLSFSFSKIDANKSHFYFQLQLKTPDFVGDELKSNLEKSIELRKKMKADGIFLVYKGIISEKIIHPITDMVDFSIHSSTQKKVVFALMQFLQDSSKQGISPERRSEGTFVIGKNEKEYKVGSTSFIHEQEVAAIEHLIQSAATSQKTAQEIESDSQYDSTILEIAKNSSAMEYKVQKVEDGLFELTLLVKTLI